MRINAIIPAYNEENTIKNVLDAVKQVDCIRRIIVVSDGSVDDTAHIARSCSVDVIEFAENMGKGAAIKAGLDACECDTVLLLDADLIGLNPLHIKALLNPVVSSEADMSIGIFTSGRLSTDFAQKISPFLSGQRAVKKALMDSITGLDAMGYGLEMAITVYAEKEGIKCREVELPDLTHVMKEEKMGIMKGVAARIRMYRDIIKYIRAARVR